MPCSCHTKEGLSVKVASPYDQCVLCARKHVKNAWGAWNEFTYEEDNRDYISDQLRKAADHLKIDHREIALQCRDLAMAIEENKDNEIPDMAFKLDNLRNNLRELVYSEHKDAKERLERLKEPVDIIIPLSNGSSVNNAEIRILLRSIEKHLKGYGRIFIVTHYAPDWLDTSKVTLVDVDDVYNQNKDANLHKKILGVIEKYNVSDFVFCADDNVFMQDIQARAIPILMNAKPRADFFKDDLSKWQTRVKHTFEFGDAKGVKLEHHFEVHCPQLFQGKLLAEKMKDVDYVSQPGLTIYTTWRIVTSTCKTSLFQNDHKLTLENECAERLAEMTDQELQGKLFLGYNDGAITGGIIERLKRIFPNKSSFEN